MSNPDPNLQKLVDGAQRHVKSPGSTNARDEMMLRSLNEYEDWREQNLAGPNDAENPGSKETGVQ